LAAGVAAGAATVRLADLPDASAGLGCGRTGAIVSDRGSALEDEASPAERRPRAARHRTVPDQGAAPVLSNVAARGALLGPRGRAGAGGSRRPVPGLAGVPPSRYPTMRLRSSSG